MSEGGFLTENSFFQLPGQVDVLQLPRAFCLHPQALAAQGAQNGPPAPVTPKAWQREIDLLTAQKQVDSIDMKAMREELKAVERLRKAADQLARQERDKPRDRGPER